MTQRTPACLIVSAQADALLNELDRQCASSIPARACHSAVSAQQSIQTETILFGDPKMIAELLDDVPQVAWVHSSWAGVTPLIRHHRRDYRLTAVKDVFGPQMAEYSLGYLLAHELKIREREDAQQRRAWQPTLSGTLRAKRLGIMGTGSIGRHIARQAQAFDLRVSGYSRSGQTVSDFERVHTIASLHEFLEGLDYLVCALPETDQTNQLLDSAALGCLPEHAVLINVGRANIIDEDALTAALNAGRLAAAVLDVFDTEPLPADSKLWTTPKLSITAHIAAISHPQLIVPQFVDNYRRFVDGNSLRGQVDFTAGY